MKKIITALTIAVSLLILTFCFSACNLNLYTYDKGDSYTVGGGEFAMDTVDSLDIDWVSGKVVVKTDATAQKITLSEDNSKSEDKYQMRHYLDAQKTLRIRFVKDGTSISSINLKKELTVTLPADETKLFSEIDIETVSADFTGDGFNATNIDIETVSGGVDLINVDTTYLDVETVSGNITCSDISSKNIDLDSVSGKFDFNGAVSGSIESNTVSGDFEIHTSTMPTSIECDTVSGDITLYVPENDGFGCIFKTISGDFYSNFAVTTSGKSHTYGNGSVVIDIKSTSGNLRINRI